MSEKKFNLKDNKIQIIRHIVQAIAFLFINYVIIEFIFSINLISFEGAVKLLPILNSPRNPLSDGAGFTEYIFYFISEGIFPFFLVAIFLIIVLFTNRVSCGWLCPIGAIQDGLSYIRPKRKKTLKTDTHKTFLNLKYVIIIGIIIIVVPLGVTKTTNIVFYFQYRQNLGALGNKPIGYFSLSEYIFVFFPNLIQDMIDPFTLEPLFSDLVTFVVFVFYIIVIITAIYIPRVYCRYICPYAAISSVISDYSFLKLSRSPVKCVGRAQCGICERVCPKQIRILDEPFEFFTGKGECNFCLNCLEKCPYDAIEIKFG